MKTQGELEAAIWDGIRCFEQDHMGRGPKEIHTRLLNDLLVVRTRKCLLLEWRPLRDRTGSEINPYQNCQVRALVIIL
jgi:hypothetical protein